MSKKPWQLYLVASVNWIVALSLPLQVMALYGHTIGELGAIFNKITILNWLVVVVCMANGFIVWSGHRWFSKSSMVAIVVVALNNWVVAAWGTDFSWWTPVLGTIAFSAVHATLFASSVQSALKKPQRTMVFRPRRYNREFPVWIETQNRQIFEARTFDISLGGAFIPFGYKDAGEELGGFPVPLRRGESILVRFGLGDDEELICRAEVVRRSQATGKYPGGLGVRFSALDVPARRRLQNYLESGASI